jgi:hypothetical protein
MHPGAEWLNSLQPIRKMPPPLSRLYAAAPVTGNVRRARHRAADTAIDRYDKVAGRKRM